MEHQQWVFDCHAPLDAFERRMREALHKQGWTTSPAQLHDFMALRGRARCFVKLAHHDQGILVVAKLKAGLFGDTGGLARVAWFAAREAQIAVAAEVPHTSTEHPRATKREESA